MICILLNLKGRISLIKITMRKKNKKGFKTIKISFSISTIGKKISKVS